MSLRSTFSALALVFTSLFTPLLYGGDVQLGATFVCNGERMYVENCNIRDTSDTSTCMVAHPDRPQKNGVMVYTYETRGSLKKLLPTCKQPSAEEVKKANDFQRIQSQKLAANIKKANDELDESDAKWEAAINGGHPLSAEERQMYRCIAAGRASGLCTGKIFSNFLASAVNMLLPGAVHEGEPGISLAGRYQGKGWLIDFDSRSANTACSILSSQPSDYTVELRNNLPVVTIRSKPKNIVLNGRADGALVGSGPITVDGFIVEGGGGAGSYSAGEGHWETHTETSTREYTPLEASSSGIAQDPTLHQNGQYYYTTSTETFSTYKPATPTYSGPTVTLIPKTANCSQPVLTAPPAAKDTTLGLRMRGTYLGINGLSIEFYPDSAIVGCGKAARAYPYIVRANGSQAAVKIEDPAHPLVLAIKADGELDPGQGQYAVLGRVINGSNGHGGLTFAPLSATCNLETLAAADAHETPAGNSSASGPPTDALGAGMSRALAGLGAGASSGGPASAPASSPAPTAPSPSVASTASRPAPAAGGNALLSINSGFPAQPGAPNPLAGHPYILLRESFPTMVAKAGVQVPAGQSPYKYMGYVCGNHLPDCQKISAAVNANAASAVRADATGKATFAAVSEGTYYLMISARYNNQALVWDMPVHLKPGNNSLTLDQANASILH
jgi:hypothetical protein